MLHSHAHRQFTIWHGTNDYGGSVTEFKPPMSKLKTAERRPGGIAGPLDTRHGFEKPTTEITLVGMSEPLFDLIVGQRIDQERFFLRAGWEDEISGEAFTEVYTMQGRCTEHDLGDRKPDEDVSIKLVFSLVFWSHEYAGSERYYFDLLNNNIRQNGVPITDAVNAALGRGGT